MCTNFALDPALDAETAPQGDNIADDFTLMTPRFTPTARGYRLLRHVIQR